jgi:hypothetical protein
MIRRDAAQDGDRPHYYSQYWINVALGKPTGVAAEASTATVLGGPDLDTEPAYEPPPPPPPPAPVRPEPARTKPRPVERKQEPARLSSLADLANIEELMKNSAAMEDDIVPDIETGAANATEEPPIVIDATHLDDVAEDTEAELAADDDEEFDEEEEEDEWGGRRPGRSGPSRPTKPPKRPERRRDF